MADTDVSPADDPRSWRDAWPFFIAVGVVAVTIVIVVLLNVLHPASDRLTDSALISRVINDQYTARNSLDYATFRELTCADDVNAPDFPGQQAFTADNGKLRDTQGQLVIDEIADTTVDGAQATANVTWHRAGKDSHTTVTATTLVKQGDDWKVCGRGR
ncbi:Rv0361 family membrane protein [Williamsia sterculiae]|uniref:Rv0361 family membrane protein n=1 Tax=Williamsia sterculiae TaxID=1344003 RepID=UPI0009F9A0A7|nr:hypothetical protein [Williamsia sterculiae]